MSVSSPLFVAILALVAGAWLAFAVWASRRAWGRARDAEAVIGDHGRLEALLDAGPAMPLLVAADGAIGGSARLAGALGLEALPPRWMGLFGDGAPFPPAEAALLGRHLDDAASGGVFSLLLRPAG